MPCSVSMDAFARSGEQLWNVIGQAQGAPKLSSVRWRVPRARSRPLEARALALIEGNWPGARGSSRVGQIATQQPKVDVQLIETSRVLRY